MDPGYSGGVETGKILTAYRQHSRRFEDFRFVYPVLSRRSHGISIGINVNPDKICNFDCIYCQVDRSTESPVKKFDLAVAEEELRALLEMARSGDLARHPPFDSVPADLLRLNDVALSGDAEPTTLPKFSETIAMIVRVKPPDVKLVLITDAAGLDRADVRRGLAIMDKSNGEVWAKLDAGTEEYFQVINRTKISFARILKNIGLTAKERPIVIQSLFLKLHGQGPSPEELAAWCRRLRDILDGGGRIRLVQVYTVARPPMTVADGVPSAQFVAPLSNAEVDAIAEQVRRETGLPVECSYGN